MSANPQHTAPTLTAEPETALQNTKAAVHV